MLGSSIGIAASKLKLDLDKAWDKRDQEPEKLLSLMMCAFGDISIGAMTMITASAVAKGIANADNIPTTNGNQSGISFGGGKGASGNNFKPQPTPPTPPPTPEPVIPPPLPNQNKKPNITINGEQVGDGSYKGKEAGISPNGKGPGEALKKPRVEPVDLKEKLVLDEAKSGLGEVFMQGKVNDPKFKNTHDKMRHEHSHPDGSKTEIHYWKDRITGETSGFKFKDRPDNFKSRKELTDSEQINPYFPRGCR